MVRRRWIAGVLGTILFSTVGLTVQGNGYGRIVFALTNILLFYAILWAVERFGLLAAIASGLPGMTYNDLPSFSSWYIGRSFIVIGISVFVSAWALWVVLSAQKRPATESA